MLTGQWCRTTLLAGACAAFTAVGLGAFAAHGLRSRLSSDQLAIFHTAVEYQFYHALGLLAVGLLIAHFGERALLRWSGGLMIFGIVVFSGSLYLLVLISDNRWGAVTPFGGLAWLAAWLLLAAAAWRYTRQPASAAAASVSPRSRARS